MRDFIAVSGQTETGRRPGSMDMTEDYGLVRCLFEFSIGISLFYLRDLLKDKINSRVSDFFAFISVVSIVVCLQMDSGDLLSVGISALLIFFLSLSDGRLTKVLNLRMFQFFGKISFSIYVWHAFFGKVFESTYKSLGNPLVSLATGAALYFGLSLFIIVFSSFSYDLIEVKFSKFLKNKFLKKPKQKEQNFFVQKIHEEFQL